MAIVVGTTSAAGSASPPLELLERGQTKGRAVVERRRAPCRVRHVSELVTRVKRTVLVVHWVAQFAQSCAVRIGL